MPRSKPPYIRELGFSLEDEMKEFHMTHMRHLEELRDAREERIYKHSRSDTVSQLYLMQGDDTVDASAGAAHEAEAQSGETEASCDGEVKKRGQGAVGGHSTPTETQNTEGSKDGRSEASKNSVRRGRK